MILYFSNEVSMLITHYIHEFTYNEEAQLLGISHCGTLTYEYAYGADGNRRWSKDIANNRWTWYPCGVACGAGEMVEETSTLTGSSWSVSSQYLRAGGGCSSMLIRQKITTMNDEYHHADIVGMYPILTDASANVLRSYVFDAYAVPQSQQQFIGESYPVQSTYTGTCLTGISESGMQSSPNGGADACQARVLLVTNKFEPAPLQCIKSYNPHCKNNETVCMQNASAALKVCLAADAIMFTACMNRCSWLCIKINWLDGKAAAPDCISACVAGCAIGAVVGGLICFVAYLKVQKICPKQYDMCDGTF